jgi:hypothetical protein
MSVQKDLIVLIIINIIGGGIVATQPLRFLRVTRIQLITIILVMGRMIVVVEVSGDIRLRMIARKVRDIHIKVVV